MGSIINSIPLVGSNPRLNTQVFFGKGTLGENLGKVWKPKGGVNPKEGS